MNGVDAMRGGDRQAYQAILAEHGAGLQPVLQNWSEDLSAEALFIYLWQASMFAPEGVDERAYLAATAVGWLVMQTEAGPTDLPYAQADLVDFGKAAARKSAGISRDGDELSLKDAHQPGADALLQRIEQATQAILQGNGPWTWAQTHWDELVEKLR